MNSFTAHYTCDSQPLCNDNYRTHYIPTAQLYGYTCHGMRQIYDRGPADTSLYVCTMYRIGFHSSFLQLAAQVQAMFTCPRRDVASLLGCWCRVLREVSLLGFVVGNSDGGVGRNRRRSLLRARGTTPAVGSHCGLVTKGDTTEHAREACTAILGQSFQYNDRT